MGIGKRTWDFIGYAVGAYTIYGRLQSAWAAKNSLYSTLSPDQQAEWDKVFGKPSVSVALPPQPMLNIQMPAPTTAAGNVVQIQAGT